MKRFRVIFGLLACIVCQNCVQPTFKQEVNFSIDMRNVDTFNTVGIRGNFEPLSWKEDLILEDPNSDGIYTKSIVFDSPFTSIEFKFVKDNKEYELKDKANRRLEFSKERKTNFSGVFDQE